MPVRYSKQTQKSGAAIGTVISIPKPSTWSDSSNLATESSSWNVEQNYPGWLECDGRLINVSEYRALYEVLGNTYGGTAGQTFRLPDYRAKKLMGTGVLDGNKGTGLSLTPTVAPTGNSGGSIELPGSQGGLYNVSTVRQLPSGSEITPGSPSNPPSIGGSADDTFSIGSFSTTGFTGVIIDVQPNFSGNISFSAGDSSNGTGTRTLSSAPPHDHYMRHVVRQENRASSGSPYFDGARVGFVNRTFGSPITWNRGGQAIRSHSHYICWGSAPIASSFGNDNGPGNGLYNSEGGSKLVHSEFFGNFTNNIGPSINKTINLVNDAGVSLNPGTFTMKEVSRSDFDASLSVRLEAAEEIVLMSPYFRLKYIIKAY
jgi:hypothetical protein